MELAEWKWPLKLTFKKKIQILKNGSNQHYLIQYKQQQENKKGNKVYMPFIDDQTQIISRKEIQNIT